MFSKGWVVFPSVLSLLLCFTAAEEFPVHRFFHAQLLDVDEPNAWQRGMNYRVLGYVDNPAWAEAIRVARL